jgi:hypothetical protein
MYYYPIYKKRLHALFVNNSFLQLFFFFHRQEMRDGDVHVVTDNEDSNAVLLIQRHFWKLYWVI